MSQLMATLTICMMDEHQAVCLQAMAVLAILFVTAGHSAAAYAGCGFVVGRCSPLHDAKHRTACAAVLEKLRDSSVCEGVAACVAAIAGAVGADVVVQGMAAGMLHLNPAIREATISTMSNVRMEAIRR